MKLSTAFKLSAVALAFASTSAFAATSDTSVVNDAWTDPTQKPVGTVDAGYQYVDFGSGVLSQTGAGTVERNTLVELHDVNGVDVYKIDGKAYTIGTNNTLVAYDESKGALTDSTFQYGGTANNLKAGDVVTTAVVARTDTNQVVYGEKVTTETAELSVDLAVTDSQGVAQAQGTYNEAGASTDPVVTSEKSVALGILGQDANGNNQYGVKATEGDKSTTLDANGITTTGSISAASITVGGKDLTAAITAAGDAKGYTDTKAEETLKAADAAAKAGDAATLEAANLYTDNALANFNSGVNNLSKRLDDVEETAYRGTAIALAAAQQVPNIKAGQFALFGGVGHYEGETAVAAGGVYAVSETVSISGALGTAGNEVGGRVGASFIFGAAK